LQTGCGQIDTDILAVQDRTQFCDPKAVAGQDSWKVPQDNKKHKKRLGICEAEERKKRSAKWQDNGKKWPAQRTAQMQLSCKIVGTMRGSETAQ